MTTFSLVQGAGAYVAAITNNRTLIGITAGNILIAFVSARDGTASSTMSISDDNSGTWNYVDNVNDDNELGNSNARFAIRKAWRVVESAEDGDNLVITGTTSANNNGTFVAEIQPSATFVPSLLASSTTGSGTVALDTISTSTGSISGTDLLHVFIQGLRVGTAVTYIDVSEYTVGTEYEKYESLSGNNQISGAIGAAIDGQSASGVVTITSAIGGASASAAEGIIAQFVFENNAGASQNLTGTDHVNTNSFGSGTIEQNGSITGTDHVNTNSFGSGTITGGVSNLISDDFSSGIDTNIWSSTTPGTHTSITAGDSDGEYFVEIAVINNTDADPYSSLANSPLFTQLVDDTDFDIKARWLTQPDLVAYKGHGFIIRNASGDWIRFDLNSSATNYFAYSASTIGGSTTGNRINDNIGTTWYEYLRVTRTGDTWLFRGSNDNENWTTFDTSYNLAFNVDNISLTTLSSNNSTGYYARVDWIEDSTDPILIEDPIGGITGTSFTNTNSFGSGTVSAGTAIITGVDYVDPDVIGSGTIDTSISLTGSIYVDPDVIGSGIVSPGMVNISGANNIDPDTIGTGTVSAGIVNISGTSFTNTNSFGSGTVGTAATNISGTIHSDPDIIGSGSISTGAVIISGSIHTNTNSFGSGTADNVAAGSEIITWPAGGAGSADFETTLDSGWSYTDGFSGTLDTSIFAIVNGQVEYQYGLVNGVDPGTVPATTGQANPYVSTPISGDFDYYALISESPLGYHDGGYLGYGFTVYNGSESSRWEMYMAPAAVGISTYVRIGSGIKTSSYTYPDINRGYPTHMRLQRVSGVFTFSASMDGTNWTTIATVSDRVDFAPTTLGVYGYKFGSSNTVAYSPKLELVHANSIAQPTVAESVTRTNIWNSAFIDSSEIDNQSLLGGTITFNAGTMTLSTPSTDGATSRFAYIDSDLPADIGVLLKVRSIPAGSSMYAGIQLRANSWRGTDWTPHYGPPIGYVSELHGTTSTQRLISIHATNTNTDGGYWNFMQAAASVAGSPENTYLWHRFEAIGPVIRMKTWHADSDEPAAWELQVVDRTIQDPGAFGIAWSKNDGNTSAGDLEISDLSLYSITSGVATTNITGTMYINEIPSITFDTENVTMDDSDVTMDQTIVNRFGSGTLEVGPPNFVINGLIHNDPDVIGSGTISTGSVTITGSIYVDPDSFGAGEVQQGINIDGVIYNDPDTIGSGSITSTVNISGTIHNDPDVIGSGTVTPGIVTISGTIHNDPDIIGSGTIQSGVTNISGSAYVDPDVIGSGQVDVGVATITGSIHNDPDTIGSGTITAGSVSISGTIYNDPDIFGSGQLLADVKVISGTVYIDPDVIGSGSVSVSTVDITGSVYNDPDVIGSGTISSAAYEITGSVHNDPDIIGSGSLTQSAAIITGSVYEDPDVIGSGTINVSTITISGSVHNDPDEFSSGQILVDAKVISGTVYNDPDIIGSGQVDVGAVNIDGSTKPSGNTFGSGTVTPQAVVITGTDHINESIIGSGTAEIVAYEITGNGHTNTQVFGSGTIQTGSVTINGTIYNEINTFGVGILYDPLTLISTGSARTIRLNAINRTVDIEKQNRTVHMNYQNRTAT